ncbi:MAG: YitT family protein [Ruminococcaceae bacterium]|nr:YitT family protein [Oscillospiraceae bacterium]
MTKSLSITLKKYALVTLGSILYAAGVTLFLDPNELASGGVSGIAIIVSNFIDIFPVGVWIVLINVPIMIAGVIKLGWKILLPTFYALVVSSGAMTLFEYFIPPVTQNALLACAGGAVLASAGIGLVFRGGATTAGTDIIVKLLKLKFKHVSTGAIFLFTDGLVCLASGIAFGNIDKALYAGIAVFIQMNVLNMVLYGSDEARMVYIISRNDESIAKRLLEEIDAGATYLYGNGAYTGQDRKVLMCVLKMRTLPEAREIVRQEDSDAFMIVTKATSVFGEGFKSHIEDDL